MNAKFTMGKLSIYLLLVASVNLNVYAAWQNNGGCDLLVFLPFTSSYEIPEGVTRDNDSQYNLYSPQAASRLAFSYSAAALMAIDHFNNRDGSVVPQLAEIEESCTFHFPTPKIVDSETDGGTAVKALWEETYEALPCAILGPVEEQANFDLVPPINAFDIPLISYYNENQELVKAQGTIGTTLSIAGRADAMLRYLRERQFLAIWHTATVHETQLAKQIESLSGPDLEVKTYRDNFGDDTEAKLREMRDTGIKTIFFSVWEPAILPGYAYLLDQLGMFGDDYFYILPPDLVPTDTVDLIYGEQAPGSPVDKLLSGAIIFDSLDLFRYEPDNDLFLQAWQSQTNETVAKLNSIIPPSAYYGASPDFFQRVTPANFASFVYDSIITIGMGGCIAQGGGENVGTPNPSQAPTPNPSVDTIGVDDTILTDARTITNPSAGQNVIPPLDGNITTLQQQQDSDNVIPPLASDSNTNVIAPLEDVFNINRRLQSNSNFLGSMQRVSFDGASGKIAFGEELYKERNSEDVRLGVYNVRPGALNDETGKRTYTGALVSTFRSDIGWMDTDGLETVYRSGETVAPEVVREIFELNYISKGVRGMGLTLLAVAWIVAFTALGLLIWLEKDGAVQRAQPFFMKILCLGSIVMSTAIFTLSWDEGAGWSDRQLDFACMLTPWFFFIGQVLTFCALFTKLWRVDKVLQFRRRAVSVSNVIKPLIILLASCVSILAVWTVLDPWTWDRQLIDDIRAESYGECKSKSFWYYVGPLVCLLFLAEALTFYFAWKTADVPEDFRDSGAVMYASFAQLQSWSIGIPMLAVLGDSSADATYFGRIFLIWIFAVSSVLVVVGPKVVKAIRIRLNPALGNKKGRVNVTGLYASNSRHSSYTSGPVKSHSMLPNHSITSTSAGAAARSPASHLAAFQNSAYGQSLQSGSSSFQNSKASLLQNSQHSKNSQDSKYARGEGPMILRLERSDRSEPSLAESSSMSDETLDDVPIV